MTINDVVTALSGLGFSYGGTDFLTSETVLEGAVLEESINGDGGLTLSWKSDTPTVIAAGTVLNGFVMMSTYAPSLGSNGIYQHSPKFSEPGALLGRMLYYKTLQMRDAEGNVSQTALYTFSFVGSAAIIAEDFSTFVASQSGGWSVVADVSGVEGTINVSFDGDTIKSAAQKIADACGLNVIYSGRAIHIGSFDAYAADEYYNRFIVLGGTKNMAKRTATGMYAAVTQRLTLDDNGSIIDNSNGQPPMTKLLVFDNIYPKMELLIASATPRYHYLLDQNGNKIPDGEGTFKQYTDWYITLKNTDGSAYSFNRNLIIQNRTLGILFQSGALTGREFELTYFEDAVLEKKADDVGDGHTTSPGEFRISGQYVGEYLLPSASICPAVNQKVTLTNVKLDSAYVTQARAELRKAGESAAGIYGGAKVANYSAENLWPDFLTGGGGASVGDSGGSGGYIVTSVRTDLITGAQTVTYGTFKPKGLISSLIDKVDGASVSGTGTAAIDDSDDFARAGTGTDAFQQLQLAGGNIGFFNLTQRVNQAVNLWSIDEVAGEIAYLLYGYNSVKNSLASGVTVTIQMNGQEQLEIGVGGSPFTPTTRLLELFTAYYNIRRGVYLQSSLSDQTPQGYSFTMYGSTNGNSYHQYDLYLHAYTLASPTKEIIDQAEVRGVIEGGLEVFMYADGSWKIIREFVASLIANMSGKIYALAYGSSGDGGFMAKIGEFDAFANKFDRDSNGNVVGVHGSSLVLTGSDGTLSTFYSYIDPNTGDSHTVTASIATQVYSKTEGGETTWHARLLLDAENVYVNGSSVHFTANDYLGLTAGLSTGTDTVGLIAGRETTVGTQRVLQMGSFANNNFIAGMTLLKVTESGTDKWKLNLTADSAIIDAESIVFSGKTITIAASQTLSFVGAINGNNQGTIDFRSAKVLINAGEISITATQINNAFSGYTGVILGKDNNGTLQIGKFDNNNDLLAGIEFTLENNRYVLNLNGDKINLNAEEINWLGSKDAYTQEVTYRYVIGDAENPKFYVDDEGNVTMNNLTANNGTFTGNMSIIGKSSSLLLTNESDSSHNSVPVIKGIDGSNVVFRLGPAVNVPPGGEYSALVIGTSWLRSGSIGVQESINNNSIYAQITPATLTLQNGNGTDTRATFQMTGDGLKIAANAWPGEGQVGSGCVYKDANGFLKVKS